MGAGATIAAAEAIGYRSIGIERSPDYFAMAKTAIVPLAKLRVGGW
jgi:site-specific DNA-methyltransferase (adenine-specific)